MKMIVKKSWQLANFNLFRIHLYSNILDQSIRYSNSLKKALLLVLLMISSLVYPQQVHYEFKSWYNAEVDISKRKIINELKLLTTISVDLTKMRIIIQTEELNDWKMRIIKTERTKVADLSVLKLFIKGSNYQAAFYDAKNYRFWLVPRNKSTNYLMFYLKKDK